MSFYEAAAYAAWAGKRAAHRIRMGSRRAACSTMAQVWEWTRSSYDPYPGFKPFEGVAAEYNGKFMVGQMVLRGGSSRHPARPYPRHLSQFLPAVGALAVLRHSSGGGYRDGHASCSHALQSGRAAASEQFRRRAC